MLPGCAHPAGVRKVRGGADGARQAQHAPRSVGALHPDIRDMGAAQGFCVAERPRLVEVTGCYRVAMQVAWVQCPPQFAHVATITMPRTNATAFRPCATLGPRSPRCLGSSTPLTHSCPSHEEAVRFGPEPDHLVAEGVPRSRDGGDPAASADAYPSVPDLRRSPGATAWQCSSPGCSAHRSSLTWPPSRCPGPMPPRRPRRP